MPTRPGRLTAPYSIWREPTRPVDRRTPSSPRSESRQERGGKWDTQAVRLHPVIPEPWGELSTLSGHRQPEPDRSHFTGVDEGTSMSVTRRTFAVLLGILMFTGLLGGLPTKHSGQHAEAATATHLRPAAAARHEGGAGPARGPVPVRRLRAQRLRLLRPHQVLVRPRRAGAFPGPRTSRRPDSARSPGRPSAGATSSCSSTVAMPTTRPSTSGTAGSCTPAAPVHRSRWTDLDLLLRGPPAVTRGGRSGPASGRGARPGSSGRPTLVRAAVTPQRHQRAGKRRH